MAFLRQIDGIYETLDVKGDKFENYFQKVSLVARSDPNYQLDSSRIDSLRSFFNDYIDVYDRGLTKLDTLKEFDTSFYLVELNAKILMNFKNSWTSVIPTFLKVFKTGWRDASDSDRLTIQSVRSIMGKYSIETDELSKQLEEQGVQFGEKYGFKYRMKKG